MIVPGVFLSTQNSAAIRAPKGSPKGSSWAPKMVPGVTSEAPLEQKGQHRVHYGICLLWSTSGIDQGSKKLAQRGPGGDHDCGPETRVEK